MNTTPAYSIGTVALVHYDHGTTGTDPDPITNGVRVAIVTNHDDDGQCVATVFGPDGEIETATVHDLAPVVSEVDPETGGAVVVAVEACYLVDRVVIRP